jgi:hypothetical protein
MSKATILQQAANELYDPGMETFTTDILEAALSNVVDEISDARPLLKRVNLPFLNYTPDVDISSLTDFMSVISISYPVSTAFKPRFFYLFGTVVHINGSPIPTITSETLTGTITFTSGSTAVTGAGSKFTTEIKNYGETGYLIGVSTGYKFYQVAYVTSDTALVLMEPFNETTVTDTIATTKYRDYKSCIKMQYAAAYTVSETSFITGDVSSVNFVLGIVAHVASEYALSLANSANPGGDAFTRYKALGDEKMTKYQAALVAMGRIEDGIIWNYSEDLSN